MATTKKTACAGCTTANATIARQCGELKAMAAAGAASEGKYRDELNRRARVEAERDASRIEHAILTAQFIKIGTDNAGLQSRLDGFIKLSADIRAVCVEGGVLHAEKMATLSAVKALAEDVNTLNNECSTHRSMVASYQHQQDEIHNICAEAGIAKARTMTTVTAVKALAGVANDARRSRDVAMADAHGLAARLAAPPSRPFCADLAIAELTAERDALKRDLAKSYDDCAATRSQRDGVKRLLTEHGWIITFGDGSCWKAQSPAPSAPATPATEPMTVMPLSVVGALLLGLGVGALGMMMALT